SATSSPASRGASSGWSSYLKRCTALATGPWWANGAYARANGGGDATQRAQAPASKRPGSPQRAQCRAAIRSSCASQPSQKKPSIDSTSPQPTQAGGKRTSSRPASAPMAIGLEQRVAVHL